MGSDDPAAPPVRDPAWHAVPLRAIGLLGHRGRHRRRGRSASARRCSCSSSRRRWAARRRCCAGVLPGRWSVVDAVVAIGVRPRLRYRVHRWEVTDEAVYTLTGWLSRTWTLVPISRIQTVDVTRGVLQQLFGLATVAVLTASSQGTVRVPHLEADVAAAGGRRPGPAGGAGPRRGHVSGPDRTGRRPGPVAARRTSRIVLVHTVTFRQARQFVPRCSSRSSRPPGSAAAPTTVVALVVGVTLLSLGYRGARPGGGSATPTARPRWSSPAGCCPGRCAPCPTTGSAGVEVEAPRACTGCSAWCGCASTRPPGRCTGNDEELVVDGVPRAEGDRLRTAVLTHRAVRGGPGADGARGRAGRGGVRPVRQPVAALRPAGRQLPGGPAGRRRRAASGCADELPRALAARPRRARPADGWARRRRRWSRCCCCSPSAPSSAQRWSTGGFRLVRRGGSLIAVRGLLTRRHTELEIDRIRGGTVSEGLGMRWVRAARVNALVTGLGDATRRGQLLPLGPARRGLVAGPPPGRRPRPARPHPPAARRRRIVRAAAAGGLLVTAAGTLATVAAGWWWVLVARARARRRSASRWAWAGTPRWVTRAGPRSFSVRSGWLVREQVDPAAPGRRRLAGAAVASSSDGPGLATVVACVGAGDGRLRGARHGRRRRRAVHRGRLGAVGRDLQRRRSLLTRAAPALARRPGARRRAGRWRPARSPGRRRPVAVRHAPGPTRVGGQPGDDGRPPAGSACRNTPPDSTTSPAARALAPPGP